MAQYMYQEMHRHIFLNLRKEKRKERDLDHKIFFQEKKIGFYLLRSVYRCVKIPKIARKIQTAKVTAKTVYGYLDMVSRRKIIITLIHARVCFLGKKIQKKRRKKGGERVQEERENQYWCCFNYYPAALTVRMWDSQVAQPPAT